MAFANLKTVNYEHIDNTSNLQWYVLRYNDNSGELEMWNIFNNWRFCKYVEQHLVEDLTFEEFVEELDRELHYYFWSKFEHEIHIRNVDKNSNSATITIDVYAQVKPNIRTLANYIIDNWVV